MVGGRINFFKFISLLALVMFLVSACDNSTSDIVDEDGAIVGKATFFKDDRMLKQIKYNDLLEKETKRDSCEADCGSLYEISAYAMQGNDWATYVVDGEPLMYQGYATVNSFSNGVEIIHNSSINQDYAAGFRGTSYNLNNACPTDLYVVSYMQNLLQGDQHGYFEVNSEVFELDAGESYVTVDGYTFILSQTFVQEYAGGNNGVKYFLFC